MDRDISNTKQQEEFFNILGDDDITSEKIIKIFSRSLKSGIKFLPSDTITISSKHSKFVSGECKTSIGIYIINKYIIEDMEIFGYINKTFDGGLIKRINEIIPIAKLEEEITQDQIFRYLDRCQFLFGGTLAHIINTSLSPTILHLPKDAKALKEKLLKENEDAIKNGDPLVASEIEKAVCTKALESMRTNNDPAMNIFDSGCGVDAYNNFKTMFVMKGAITDNTGESKTGYKTVVSDYDNGITKEDMPIIADSLVTSAYSKGVMTQVSGYSGKKHNSLYQRVKLGPRGSDCHTTETKKVLVTENNSKSLMMYRYIMEHGKPVMLTPKTISRYIGKVVDLRTPGKCKYPDPEYCNVCSGDRSYRLDITNVGLAFNIAAGAMLNANMKKFHDITIKYYALDIDKDILKFANKK